MTSAAPLQVRPYQTADRAAVRRICCETAHLGMPFRDFFLDEETFADLWTRYYTDEDPAHTWVAVDQGRVVGYLTGCVNESRYRAAMVRIVTHVLWDLFRRRRLFDRRLRHFLWINRRLMFGGLKPALLRQFPAHFHINLDAAARGRGAGELLVDRFKAQVLAAGEKGLRAVTQAENEGAWPVSREAGFSGIRSAANVYDDRACRPYTTESNLWPICKIVRDPENKFHSIVSKPWQSSQTRRIVMGEVSEGEYKGNVMLIIRRNPDDKFPFQFGVKKAQLILEHLDDIKKFVEKHKE